MYHLVEPSLYEAIVFKTLSLWSHKYLNLRSLGYFSAFPQLLCGFLWHSRYVQGGRSFPVLLVLTDLSDSPSQQHF